jgi:hypothetical protein
LGDAVWIKSPAVVCLVTSDEWRQDALTGLVFIIVSIAASIMEPFIHASAVFPKDALTIEGETRDYAGPFFCPRCGSFVFFAQYE